MAAHGDAEIEATLTRLHSLAGGRVSEGALDDGEPVPRDADGGVLPHIIADFGAPVRSARERNLANPEAGQPHILPLVVYCVAGSAADARKLSVGVFNRLIDWAPSDTADAYRPEGGFGQRRPATSNTPTRFVKILFFETTVNQGIEGPWD